jgi:hypothetical protein
MIDILDAFMKKFFLFWWKKVNLFKNEVLEIKAFKRLIYLPKTIVWFVDELPFPYIFHKKRHVKRNVWRSWSSWETILSSRWPFWMYFMITCQQVKQLSSNCNYISNEKLSNKCTSILLLQNFVNTCVKWINIPNTFFKHLNELFCLVWNM